MSKLPQLLSLAALATSLSGCATLFASKTDRVYITPPPGTQFADVKVTDNGQDAKVENLTSEEELVLDYLPKGTVYVEVSSKRDHQLVVTDAGKVSQFGTGTELAIGWLVLDLFGTGPIGIVIDWVTHDWRRPTPLIVHTAAKK